MIRNFGNKIMRREFYCTLWSDLFSCLIHCLLFFGLVAGKRSLDDNEKKEYMGDMKVDGFGRKVRLRQLLLTFGHLDVMCRIQICCHCRNSPKRKKRHERIRN
jgi:hypothetical protein